MSKIQEAKEILHNLGLPDAQSNEMSALTLLALCNIREDDSWSDAEVTLLGISNGIMKFISDNYSRKYAPNTRETFRRNVLHQLVQAKIVDYNPENPELAVNSPKAHYALSNEVLPAIRSYGNKRWRAHVKKFTESAGKLKDIYKQKREDRFISVVLDGEIKKMSPGKHNEAQIKVLKEFAPRFIRNAELLYLGDTAEKGFYKKPEKLQEFGISFDEHDKIPDIIFVDSVRKWMYLIEVVTSHGPISPKRLIELEECFKSCPLGKIFVTVFPSRAEFKKYISEIAWETEVWIAEEPEHLIHFNGDKFFGPRQGS